LGSGFKRIRLRYSSFINYVGLMYRALIAIGFIIVVARKLSPPEFGLWGIILSSTLMLASITYVWLFWVQRYLGRGFSEAFGSGLVLTALYALIGLTIYFGLAYFEYITLGWGLNYLLAGSTIFVLNVFDSLIGSSLSVTKPEGLGYKRMIYETARFLIAYCLVVYAGMRLYGAILGVSGAILLGIIYGTYILARTGEVSLKPSKAMIRGWLRNSFIPGISVVQGFMNSGLRVFLSWITGSDLAVAYLNVGLSSQTPLLSASYAASPALYARTLRRVRGEDLSEVFRIYLFFTGFLATTFLVLAVPIATLYNPAYLGAYRVLILVTIYALVLGLLNLYMTALLGYEKVDLEKNARIKEIINSYLMKVPIARLAAILAAYAITLLSTYPIFKSSPLVSSELAASGLLVGAILIAPYIVKSSIKEIPHEFPLRELLVAVLGSAMLALTYYFLGLNRLVIRSIWSEGVALGLGVIVGGIIYVALWVMASEWFRGLLTAGFKRLLHKS